MTDALEDILVLRRKDLQETKERRSMSELDRLAAKAAAPLGFKKAINHKGRISIIAEMKKKSPSAGDIRSDYSVSMIAEAYKKGGARALSILTEKEYFGGEVLDLQRAKDAAGLPVLRKDFIFDPYQIAEARAFGADAVLLIADMLGPSQLKELVVAALEYKLEPLVEFFTPSVLESALASGSEMIGINNRDLRTLVMHPHNVEQLSGLIPSDRVIVAESGLKNPEDIKKLKHLPVKAALIGESLLKKNDLENAVRLLVEA